VRVPKKYESFVDLLNLTLDDLKKYPRKRSESKKDGFKYYFTGLHCKNGHLSLRYTSSNHCIRCIHDAPDSEKIKKQRNKKDYYQKNKEKFFDYRVTHFEYILYKSAQDRAKKKGIEFNIEVTDIIIPEKCPVLDLVLDKSAANRLNSPSIDRIDNSKGYVKDNIKIISTRANNLKNNGSIMEFEKILEYMKNSRGKKF
jgi:hypothetical protein